MGCSNTNIKDKRIAELTHKMNLLKVEKVDILQERSMCLKELEKITGKPQKWKRVPNYISPEYEGYEIVEEDMSQDEKMSNDSDGDINKRVYSQSTKSTKDNKRKVSIKEDDDNDIDDN